ncbi:tyrosine-type recombinase/integrase [Vibrio diazotrophicus]|uniref:tyrosine-type recombinase/integrase n=1 Tax=Vibrio diazotrophicus TaxID=685 RepID=UPI00142DDE94|nr:site-specific integrase [Vibrio diazotrophicus]NIY91161.1 integrase arm-type DNA-binding domain-containing protein [Vibrio diazotrophicus]
MTKRITDSWLRSVNGKTYEGAPEITYRDGLGLRISPKGKISWIYRFSLCGKAIRMKLGTYPEIRITDAEKVKKEKEALVSQGIDPRNKLIINRENPKPTTVKELIDYWYANHAEPNLERPEPLLTMFYKDIVPYVGDYDAKDLELFDYVKVFKIASERVSPKHSANLMARFKGVLSFSVRHGLLKYNVISELKKNDVGKPTSVRSTKQEGSNVRRLWQLLSDFPAHPSNRNILKLLMIFGCRGVELRLAKKTDFDFEKLIWTVPEEHNKIRHKGGGEIRRAIPELAVSILREQFAMFPNCEVVFPQVNKKSDTPISGNTLVDVGKRFSCFVGSHGLPPSLNHDMRRTARNWWESAGFNPKVSDVMLGHKVHTGTKKHYLDYDYLDEQRECYSKWCGFITSNIGITSSVIDFDLPVTA